MNRGIRKKRDEKVRRIARRIIRETPGLDDDAFRPAVRRLAEARIAAETIYERLRDEGFSDLNANECWRRMLQTVSKLEADLNITPAARWRAVRAPIMDIAAAFARLQREHAGEPALPPREREFLPEPQ